MVHKWEVPFGVDTSEKGSLETDSLSIWGVGRKNGECEAITDVGRKTKKASEAKPHFQIYAHFDSYTSRCFVLRE